MKKTFKPQVVAFLCVVLSLFMVPITSLAESTVEKTDILLITFDSSTADNEQITQSVKNRLQNIPVNVNTAIIPTKELRQKTQAEIATQQLAQSENRLVFYWDIEGEAQIHFIVKSKTSNHLFSRELDGAGELSLEDVIVLISLSTIEFLLDSGELTPPPSPAIIPLPKPIKPSPPKSHQPPRLFMDMGYTLTMGAATPSFVHGGQIAIAYRFLKIFRIFGRFAIESSYQSEEDNVALNIRQLPFSVGFTAISTHKRIRFGGEGAVLFVSAYKKPQSDSAFTQLKEAYWSMDFQVELLGRLEVDLSRYWALFASAGARILLDKVSYQVENGPLLFDEYWRIQPTIVLGIQLMAF